MNPHSSTAPRGRRRRGPVAAAAVLGLLAAGLSVTANAHAETNRRICEYSFKAMPDNVNPNNPRDNNPLLHVSLGMNYKKKGACPTLDAQKLAETGYVDADQVNPKAPANKWTCEAWGETHQTFLNSGIGADPCNVMWVDTIYAFVWQDPTTPSAPKPTMAQLDRYTEYQ